MSLLRIRTLVRESTIQRVKLWSAEQQEGGSVLVINGERFVVVSFSPETLRRLFDLARPEDEDIDDVILECEP